MSNSFTAYACVLAILLLACFETQDANSQQRAQQTVTRQQTGNRQTPPPPIRPPQGVQLQGRRSSSKWLPTTNGGRVAVDVSVTGDGVRVYNSLTWHLVAVDENDDTKALWDRNTSAFWDQMDTEQIEIEGEEEKTWALVLRSSRYEQFAEYRNLHTGEFIKLVGEEPADGKKIKISQGVTGSGGKHDEPLYEILATEEAWKQAYDKLFAGEETTADAIKDVDFSNEAVLVYYGGKATNCRGFTLAGAYETENELLLRVVARTYQTDGGGPIEHPFGIFVVPRMTEKPYVIETDRQGLIGGPEIWKESRRFEPLGE